MYITGTLDVKSGTSAVLATYPLTTFNAPQFAYSPSTNLYSFVAYGILLFIYIFLFCFLLSTC